MTNARELLTAKELAVALKRHHSYVYAMKARGFRMPGGLATLDQALAFLDGNPYPRGHHPGPHQDPKTVFTPTIQPGTTDQNASIAILERRISPVATKSRDLRRRRRIKLPSTAGLQEAAECAALPSAWLKD